MDFQGLARLTIFFCVLSIIFCHFVLGFENAEYFGYFGAILTYFHAFLNMFKTIGLTIIEEHYITYIINTIFFSQSIYFCDGYQNVKTANLCVPKSNAFNAHVSNSK